MSTTTIQEKLLRLGQQVIDAALELDDSKRKVVSPSTADSPPTSKKKTSRAPLPSDRKTLPKGVSLHRGRYEARIYNPKTRRTKYLKSYLTVEEAANAVQKEASKLGLTI